MEMQQQIEEAAEDRHNNSRAAAVKKEEAMDMEDADEDVILVDQHQTQHQQDKPSTSVTDEDEEEDDIVCLDDMPCPPGKMASKIDDEFQMLEQKPLDQLMGVAGEPVDGGNNKQAPEIAVRNNKLLLADENVVDDLEIEPPTTQQPEMEDFGANISQAVADPPENEMIVNPSSPGLLGNESQMDSSSSNKCDQCGKCFAESSNLKKHKMVHRGQKFHCEICGRTFSRHWELTIHKSKPCKPEAADECQANEEDEDGENICVPKKPKLAENARNGGKRKHAKGKKLHACKLCPQAYDYAVNLERHLLSHTGERPHECEVCNERFFRSYTLKVHMTKHTGEKPYDCTFCGKRFNVPYLVTRHMRTHTGERPYKCGVCKRRFTQSGNLMAHKRVHTGGKPYVCEICGTRFTHCASLKKHQRSKDECKAAAEQSRGLSIK